MSALVTRILALPLFVNEFSFAAGKQQRFISFYREMAPLRITGSRRGERGIKVA
jgi:hypothetical protein